MLLGACGSSGDGSGPSSAAGSGGAAAEGGGGRQGGGTGGAPRAGSGGASAGMSGGGAGAGNAAGAGGQAGATECHHDADGVMTLRFVNGCSESLAFRGSDIAGGTLAPAEAACVTLGSALEPLSAKRYWGFVGEDPGAEHHTLAEFTFNTDFNDFDWYNISHVDAHNVPMQIVPVARDSCDTLTCADDFLAGCPEEGKFRDDRGIVVACVSPNRDDGAGAVPLYFESCDDAYAWSGDDQNGDDPSPVRACAGEDWDIYFCPVAAE